MALTITQVGEIANELAQSDDKIKSAEESIANTEEDRVKLQHKNNTIKVFYDASNNNANAYFRESRWLDGITYTELPYGDIDDAAQRKLGNIFFPGSWQQFPPFLDDKAKGLPISSSAGDESEILSDLIAQIDFIVNGQSSGVSNDTLVTITGAYSPGDPTIEVTSGGQTNGNRLMISGSGTSALVKITGVAGSVLTITELVAPAGTISPAGSLVVENIAGFTNNERNTLTSVNFDRVLDTLADDIKTAVINWNTILINQIAQHDIQEDPDRQPETDAAKTDAQNAQTIITAWQALPDTGSTGSDSKFTDNNLTSINNEASARNTFRSTRLGQINSALGVVTQDAKGKIGGQGMFRDRFERVSLQINTADGPLFQFYALSTAQGAQNQQIDSTKQKENTFNSGIFTTVLSENPTGNNSIIIKKASDFSVSDVVVITGVGLENIVANITGINGNEIELDKNIPLEYILDSKPALSKAR